MNTAKLLLSENLITNDQYEQAVLDRRSEGKTVVHHLVRRGLISSDALIEFQIDRLGMKRHRQSSLAKIPPNLIPKITTALAHRYRVIPVSQESNVLALGMTDPVDDEAMDAISRHASLIIRPVLISEEDMSWALSRYYSDHENKKTGKSAKDTMPRIRRSEVIAEPGTDDRPRETLSWGVSIEDALTNAVKITSVRDTDTHLFSIAPTPAKNDAEDGDTSGWDIEAHDVPSEMPEHTEIAPVTEAPLPLDEMTDSPNERPTVIPDAVPPLIENLESGGGLDSWLDTTPADTLQHAAEPELRTFHSVPPNPMVMEARMSLLPPHKVHQHTEGELLHEILNTNSRDELISLALEYMLRFAGRAVFLVVRKTEIRGYHIAGEYTRREAIRTFWIPFNQRSTLGQVAISGNTYLGPMGDKPADAVFCAALGGRPSHALVVPVILKHRTVGILFADQVRTQEIAWPRLNRLTEAITSSLARFILTEKTKRNSKTE